MPARKSDWALLQAYVDGELDLAATSRVAQRIARQPEMARHVANLMSAKAAMAETTEDRTDATLPPNRRTARGWQWAAIAAAVSLVLAGLALWSLPSRDGAPAWLIAGAQAHTHLAAYANKLPPDTVSAIGSFEPYLPNLSAAHLTLAAVAPLALGGLPEGVALQYTGTRGCRVTYLAFSGNGIDLGERLATFNLGSLKGYGWRVGDIGYAVLAEGMDPNRLAVIATSIHTASRLHRPFDAATRSRLTQIRAESSPCSV